MSELATTPCPKCGHVLEHTDARHGHKWTGDERGLHCCQCMCVLDVATDTQAPAAAIREMHRRLGLHLVPGREIQPLPVTAEGGGVRQPLRAAWDSRHNWGASVAIKPEEIALPDCCRYPEAALGPVGPGTCDICGCARWAHTESADHAFISFGDSMVPYLGSGSKSPYPAPPLPSATVGDPNCPTIDPPREGDYALFRLGRWEHSDTEFHRERANMLADRCQTLEDEKREILVENAELRRRLERLEKRGKR